MDSDSSSDDEFATAGSVTRRKLLESFYGQSSAGTGEDTSAASSGGAEPEKNSHGFPNEERQTVTEARRNSGDTKNLDSPYFDVAAHTSQHIVNSSVQKLLEMDEQLTLQVRTLDSTTQNMVYENYSKFIDATDAVKSVGVNVQANEQGLERLKQGMETITTQSRIVEEDLGSLRDAVAEKIRVKRLLARLDALLKLPETLRKQTAAGRHRTAASSFLRSTNILSKHSAGFESLQKIEIECNGILQEMIKDLNRKLRHWSGQEHSPGMVGSASDDEDINPYSLAADSMDEEELSPDQPSTIADIYECAGTLAMLQHENLDVDLSVESCMTMSLAATVRFLDRLFDTHQLELQEADLNVTPIPPSVGDEGATFEGDHSARSQQSHKGQHLVPTMVVDAILETATLFRISFQDTNQQYADEPDHLEEFVKEAYSSFLLHVRSVLLDYSFGQHRAEQSTDDDEEQDGDGDGDEVYEEVAGAMSILIHAVRELASGLSLPEVGVRADVAADLVEQASDLTETLVRRRVDQKFCNLRLRVVSHCLVPFATRLAVTEDSDDQGPADTDERTRMLQVVQIAVSDCLQLLDDTVRSIVSGRDASVDLSMLKQSIQASTGRFASWLAGTLEVLAGCESSDSTFSFEASDVKPADADGSATDGPGNTAVFAARAGQDDVSEMSNQYDALAEKVDDALQDLIATLEASGDVYESLEFALKVFEMCRGCERAFVDNMTQSIESNVGGSKKGRSSSGLFDDKKNVVLSEHERKTSGRFRLAASRILALYATNRGFDAANTWCAELCSYAAAENESFPPGPSNAACFVLEVVKQATADCDALFGEKQQAGPLPGFSSVVPASQPLLAMNSSPLKGLQLDVQRMFEDKISIFPHPSNILDFVHDAILTVIFKVVIKASAEQTRLCLFTADGFNRLLVDVELLRGMIPHYVDKNYQIEGSNACSSLSSLLTEVLTSAAERCEVDDCTGNDDLVRSAMSSLSDFMKSDPSTANFLIIDD